LRLQATNTPTLSRHLGERPRAGQFL